MGEIRRGMIISNDDLNDKSNATVISAREMAMVPPRFFHDESHNTCEHYCQTHIILILF